MILATARVQITVDIAVNSTWGDGCSIDQIHKQAKEEAIKFLEHLPAGRMAIRGPMDVVMVLVEKKR